MTDFEKYAISNKVNSTGLEKYKKHIDRIVCPTIIEEREVNYPHLKEGVSLTVVWWIII